MSDIAYNTKIKIATDKLIELRTNSVGGLAINMLFSLLVVLRSKNKINEDDLQTIFESEKLSAEKTLRDMVSNSYGEDDFFIDNETEIEEVMNNYGQFLNNIFSKIRGASSDLKGEKNAKSKNKKN